MNARRETAMNGASAENCVREYRGGREELDAVREFGGRWDGILLGAREGYRADARDLSPHENIAGSKCAKSLSISRAIQWKVSISISRRDIASNIYAARALGLCPDLILKKLDPTTPSPLTCDDANSFRVRITLNCIHLAPFPIPDSSRLSWRVARSAAARADPGGRDPPTT
jgi:hypothetical protein